MSTRSFAKVVTKLNKFRVVLFLALCRAIYNALTTHAAQFPALPVTLAFLLSQIQSVESAQQTVKTRVKGAVATRNDLRDALASTVETIRGYVQTLCDASPSSAATIAAMAGMALGAVGSRTKAVLAARVGTVSGLALLAANAGLLSQSKRQKFYEWQYTLDGKSWLSAPTTSVAKTSIAGLPPLTIVGFRVRATDSRTIGEWTQTVTLVIH